MKTITLSADEDLIEAAEARARAEHSTLDEQFRLWLAEYSRRRDDELDAFLARIDTYVRGDGRKFTRDEMNERSGDTARGWT
jgi:chromosomal replication initiation ATPase DnaA